MAEIVATLSHLARQSPHINQRSGVSVRLSVANHETLVANAARRALRLGEDEVVPRISDLEALAVVDRRARSRSRRLEEGRDGEIVEHLAEGGRAHRVQGALRHRAVPRGASPRSRAARSCTPATTSPSADVRRAVRATSPALREPVGDLTGGDESPAAVGQRRRVRARGPAPLASGSTRTPSAPAPPTGAGRSHGVGRPGRRPAATWRATGSPRATTGMLPWSWAEERLTRSHDYWCATTWPDGRPHVMPVWAVLARRRRCGSRARRRRARRGTSSVTRAASSPPTTRSSRWCSKAAAEPVSDLGAHRDVHRGRQRQVRDRLRRRLLREERHSSGWRRRGSSPSTKRTSTPAPRGGASRPRRSA